MTDDVRVIDSCEVCGSDVLEPVLDLGRHPMCDDLIAVGDPRRCREYPIEIHLCRACMTAHQAYQVPKETLFPRTYHYRSRFTADVIKGMQSLVDSAAQVVGGINGATVVDIGCNDGSLLDIFRAAGAATTIGIEPTGACDDAAAKGHVTFNDYLSESVSATIVEQHGAPSFVAMTNVFAHIEQLPDVVAALRRLSGPGTVLVIENHYLGAVLDRNQFDTFYHEHPRSYSYTSFAQIARSLAMQVLHVDFPSRYGGNIRVFLGRSRPGMAAFDDLALRAREAQFPQRFADMRDNVAKWRQRKASVLADLVRRHGPLRGKAFPGRAAILVKLLGLDIDTIGAVYEKPGSLKIGHYLPGTRIPIRSDEDLFASGDHTTPIVNMAWHISAEIRSYLAAQAVTAPIVDIIERADFDA